MRLGDSGEDLAAAFLEARGWKVLHRNFRLGRYEIDLIVSRDDLVAFVEVKTRTGSRFGHPAEAVTLEKRTRVTRVAEGWLEQYGSSRLVCRFDVIAVTIGDHDSPKIEHIEHAWSGAGLPDLSPTSGGV